MKKKPRSAKAAKKLARVERVTAIGGIFFKAKDPDTLAAWYRQHLGIDTKDGYTDFPWRDADRPDELGRTVWSLFPADSDYFRPSKQPFMINYRVSNLPRLLDQLRRQGVVVEKVEDHDYGRFAWVMDPEGNRIELWQPPPPK
jgi:predicted enzyme related to lactoylglutathione lyase